ncbi:hypothetical protein TELCIR_18862, partial [Teladorsagia circumcincta]
SCTFDRQEDSGQDRTQVNVYPKHRLVFPNLPLTEVLFLSKIVDRLIFLAENGDKFGWERERKFWSLVDHKDEIRADTVKMQHFEKIYKKMEIFRKDEMLDKLKELLAKAERILHPNNVYITRLRTALFHVTGSLEQNMGMMHKQIYDNYKL